MLYLRCIAALRCVLFFREQQRCSLSLSLGLVWNFFGPAWPFPVLREWRQKLPKREEGGGRREGRPARSPVKRREEEEEEEEEGSLVSRIAEERERESLPPTTLGLIRRHTKEKEGERERVCERKARRYGTRTVLG